MQLVLNFGQFMTDEEKGYHCPDNCPECPYKKTKCIVFSPEGKKKRQEWKKKRMESDK